MDDEVYQDAVDLKTDSLARMHPTDLMALRPSDEEVTVNGQLVRINLIILDLGNVRYIGVNAERKLRFGLNRTFFNGITVECTARRMTDDEAAFFD